MLSLKHALRSLFQRPDTPVRPRSEPRRLRMEWLEDRMMLCNPGELDLTFGTGGIAVTDFAGKADLGFAAAIQTDGKIVAAGKSQDANLNSIFALARYNSDGSLDTSFDGDGKVTTFGTTIVRNKLNGTTGSAWAVALQSDGKIIAAGSSNVYSKGVGTSRGFTLVRYNSNGSLDTSFGTQGVVTTNAVGLAEVRGIVLQGDGKIVAAGQAGTSNVDVGIARYNTNGTLDTTFSGDGIVTSHLGTNSEWARAVALQSDGAIVVAGPKGYVNSSNSSAFVARYTSNGNIDSAFGIGGAVTISVGSVTYLNSVAVQSDGRVVAGGWSGPGDDQADMLVARVDTNGALDSTFDGDGIRTVDFFGSRDRANGIALQQNGQIVLAGGISQPDGGGGIGIAKQGLARLNTDGSLDATFGSSGIVTTLTGTSMGANAVAVQSDGQIVTVGATNGVDFALARYCA